MADFPVVEGKRFEPFELSELFDYSRYVVRKFFEDCNTAKDVADKVIRVIQYPFYLGQPDDQHKWNHFHEKWCKTITLDYWQLNSETALFLIGDCEDSSTLTVGGMRLKGVSSDDVFEAFGVVKDANGNILGGHGWLYARDKSFGTDRFVLVESTLDTPPGQYPEAGSTLDDLKRPFRYGNIIYEPELLFNDVQFIEVSPATSDRHMILRRKRFVENREKYEAIAKAWKVNTKPLRYFRSKLARIRERL
jgi:hypothetical protein